MKKKIYDSEQALCELFAERARVMGWKVFPETSNWDLLLVAGPDVQTAGVATGDQVGIQAKLKANLDVLYQALPKERGDTGPSFHAVLVPEAGKEFINLARRLHILVFAASRLSWDRDARCNCRVPAVDRELIFLSAECKQFYSTPAWHPEIELWTPPGVRSPESITPWKVSAVRLCLDAKDRGYIMSEHFRAENTSMSRWLQKKWIIDSGQRIGRSRKYILNEDRCPPHVLYPEVAAALIADRLGTNLVVSLPKPRSRRMKSRPRATISSER